VASALAICSHLGDLVVGIRSGSSVANIGVDYGFASATRAIPNPDQIQATCSTELVLPQTLNLRHDLNRSDRISQYLKVNGFTLPSVLKMNYSRKRNTWYSNVHYTGISVTNASERLDIVFEFGCMSEDSIVGLTQNVWGFSVFVTSRRQSRQDTTKLLLEFDPITVCDINGNLKFDFTFNLNTQQSVPPLVRTALFNDYMGVFSNNSYKNNPNAVFEVSVNPPQASPGVFDQSRPLQKYLLGV
jgi:hypothetical protein